MSGQLALIFYVCPAEPDSGLILRRAHPFIEIKTAVVGAMGDKHHLMTAAIGENDEIARLGRTLQADLLFKARQLVYLLFEGESVRIHKVLHCWTIYRHRSQG